MTEEIFLLIFGLIRILLALAVLMFIGVCIAERKRFRKPPAKPRCHRCDKECEEQQVGKTNTFFVCTDVNCIEPSE